MKKSLLMVSLAAMAFASCTNEESVEVNKGRPIEFRHEMTRATAYTNENLSEFNVTAFSGSNTYFTDTFKSNNDKGTENSNTYSAETNYYWPGDGSQLSFVAYAPTSLSPTIGSLNVTHSGFTVNENIGEQIDYILGTGTGNKTDNESNGVNLTFKHLLSQIEVQAKVAENSTYTYEITGVKIAQIHNSGNFDNSQTTKWTTAEGSEKKVYSSEYTTAIKLSKDAKSVMGVNGNAILLPQTLVAWNREAEGLNTDKGAYLAVRLKIAMNEVTIFPFTKDGKSSTWAAVPISGEWKPGYKYTYILDFSNGAGWVDPSDPVDPEKPILGKPIKFTVDVSGWDGEEVNTINMQNGNTTTTTTNRATGD